MIPSLVKTLCWFFLLLKALLQKEQGSVDQIASFLKDCFAKALSSQLAALHWKLRFMVATWKSMSKSIQKLIKPLILCIYARINLILRNEFIKTVLNLLSILSELRTYICTCVHVQDMFVIGWEGKVPAMLSLRTVLVFLFGKANTLQLLKLVQSFEHYLCA